MNYIGYIGMALLLLSYVVLNTRWSKYFTLMGGCASVILTIHATLIQDIPFIVVNAFVAGMLFLKLARGNIKD